MSTKCIACLQNLLKKEELSCSYCFKKYHYACLNISDSGFKRMSTKSKDAYKCPACVCVEKKCDNSNTPLKCYAPDSPDSDSGKQDKKLLKNLEEMIEKKFVEIKNKIITEVKEIIKTELKSSLATITEELRSVTESHLSLQNDHVKLREEFNTLNLRNHLLEDNLRDLHLQYCKQQQWARQQNIEVVGVPELKNENPLDIIIKISQHAGIKLDCQDIDFANRVQPTKKVDGRPRVIVAKLKNRHTKDSIISGLKKVRGISSRDIGIPGDPKHIFVNDHLTPENKILYRKCKAIANEKAYKFVWTKNCNIFIRKNEKSPVITINAEKDLLKIT